MFIHGFCLISVKKKTFSIWEYYIWLETLNRINNMVGIWNYFLCSIQSDSIPKSVAFNFLHGFKFRNQIDSKNVEELDRIRIVIAWVRYRMSIAIYNSLENNDGCILLFVVALASSRWYMSMWSDEELRNAIMMNSPQKMIKNPI